MLGVLLPFDQAKVRGKVPPVTTVITTPEVSPLQNRSRGVIVSIERVGGPPTNPESIWVQMFKSVMVTLYKPDARLVMSSVVAPFDQIKVRGGIPPEGIRSMAPVGPQPASVIVMESVMGPGCVMNTESVTKQKLESVTVTV